MFAYIVKCLLCYKSLPFFRKHYRGFQVPEIVLVVYICKMVFKVSQSGK